MLRLYFLFFQLFLPFFSFFFIFFLFPLTCIPQSDPVTDPNIRDTILERQVFDQTILNEMDLNSDSDIDVADLVKFAKKAANLPVISFTTASSTIAEGESSSIQVKVEPAFVGEFNISVNGSALPVEDYQSPGQTVSVNGNSATIVIAIADDRALEDGENIIISLQTDSVAEAYALGATSSHIIWIEDNDTEWSTTLQVDNLTLGFDMIILEDASGYDAYIESDGNNGLPAGTWPVTLQVTQTTFDATIGPIELDEQDTMFSTNFSRLIVLSSTPEENSDHIIDMTTEINGSMTDTLLPVTQDKNYLQRVIPGTFFMMRDPALLTMPVSQLIDS